MKHEYELRELQTLGVKRAYSTWTSLRLVLYMIGA